MPFAAVVTGTLGVKFCIGVLLQYSNLIHTLSFSVKEAMRFLAILLAVCNWV